MLHDLQFAFRQLLKSPGFSLVAILTPALAIGANTAISYAIDAVLLHPLPYPDPDRLVQETLPRYALHGIAPTPRITRDSGCRRPVHLRRRSARPMWPSRSRNSALGNEAMR